MSAVPGIDGDRRRGFLLGLATGEALAAPVAGRSRDQILRQHGRVTRLAAATAIGPLAQAAAEVLAGTAAPTRSIPSPTIHAAVRALLGEPAETPLERAINALVDTARGTHPYDEIAADELLARLDPALPIDRLTADVVRPPRPRAVCGRYADLAADERATCISIHALLVRRRSIDEAVMYAVNLGGEVVVVQAALTGAVAGLHRGGAGVPRRWLDQLLADDLERLRAATRNAGLA